MLFDILIFIAERKNVCTYNMQTIFSSFKDTVHDNSMVGLTTYLGCYGSNNWALVNQCHFSIVRWTKSSAPGGEDGACTDEMGKVPICRTLHCCLSTEFGQKGRCSSRPKGSFRQGRCQAMHSAPSVACGPRGPEHKSASLLVNAIAINCFRNEILRSHLNSTRNSKMVWEDLLIPQHLILQLENGE